MDVFHFIRCIFIDSRNNLQLMTNNTLCCTISTEGFGTRLFSKTMRTPLVEYRSLALLSLSVSLSFSLFLLILPTRKQRAKRQGSASGICVTFENGLVPPFWVNIVEYSIVALWNTVLPHYLSSAKHYCHRHADIRRRSESIVAVRRFHS